MLSAAWCNFKIPFTIGYKDKITVYCYNSVNVITLGLAQSDYMCDFMCKTCKFPPLMCVFLLLVTF